MARFIDADKLIERLKVSPIFQDFGMDGYFIRDMVIDLVECQHTTDVVPSAEVEKIFDEVDSMLDLVGAMVGLDIRVYAKYAELKKKYTEKCTDCKHFVGCEKANWVRYCDEYTEGKE